MLGVQPLMEISRYIKKAKVVYMLFDLYLNIDRKQSSNAAKSQHQFLSGLADSFAPSRDTFDENKLYYSKSGY